MKRTSLFIFLCIAGLLIPYHPAEACTNLLVTKGASREGSTFITYAADSHVLYGELYFTPAGKHIPGTWIDVFEWDTGKFLGKIKQVGETYSVVGNINEFQVAIGETTYGGRRELFDPKGGADYGSLMYLALQRAKTAREAIRVMTDLVAEYGYASSGESFSISDANEVWYMELIGKGPENKGAVWVAMKIPDGCISAHANQARITTFPLQKTNDWNNPKQTVFHAADVVSFAREKGYFSGSDKDFSFTEAYAPRTFGGLRFCEARVWSAFRRVTSVSKMMEPYTTYAMGDVTADPMPLWIKPDEKISLRDVMELMRDHFEGTPMDMTKGVGAGPFELPYRWRPMTWKVGEDDYVHERAISTQQTGFSFIAQGRSSLPNPIGGILWFGVDDSYSTVYVPMYCGITRVPHSYEQGNGDFTEFSWDSAFWVFNAVANKAYSRYRDIIWDIQKVQRELEGGFIADQPEIDAAALALYKSSPRQARDYLTAYSCDRGEATVARWKKLWQFLAWKYNDGNVRDSQGNITHPPYPGHWYNQIVKDNGEVLRIKKEEQK